MQRIEQRDSDEDDRTFKMNAELNKEKTRPISSSNKAKPKKTFGSGLTAVQSQKNF